MLRVLGFLFLVLIVAAGIAGGIWYHQDRQAREFATRAIPVVFERWDHEGLMRRSIRELRNKDYAEGSRQMMQMFSQYLGPFESSEPLEGKVEYGQLDPSLPRSFFASYTSRAKYKAGKATLLLVVVKQDGGWRIGGFRVESPALLDAMRNMNPPRQGGN
jgi:hypothetical protein